MRDYDFLTGENQSSGLEGYLPTEYLGAVPELLVGNALRRRESGEHLSVSNEAGVDAPRNPRVEVVCMPPPVMSDIGIDPSRCVRGLEEHHVGIYIVCGIPWISIGI